MKSGATFGQPSSGIAIMPVMNSCMQEILEFRTCCGMKMVDQNLEVLLTNLGNQPVTILGYFDVDGVGGSTRVQAVTPPGEIRLAPGEVKALYCYMDECVWSRGRTITFYDTSGNRHSAVLEHQPEP